MRGIGQFHNCRFDDFGGTLGAKGAGVAVGGNDGKLFDDEQIQRLSLHFLPSGEVEDDSIQICNYVFSPGIWWIGSTMNRSGSEVQILAMYS